MWVSSKFVSCSFWFCCTDKNLVSIACCYTDVCFLQVLTWLSGFWTQHLHVFSVNHNVFMDTAALQCAALLSNEVNLGAKQSNNSNIYQSLRRQISSRDLSCHGGKPVRDHTIDRTKFSSSCGIWLWAMFSWSSHINSSWYIQILMAVTFDLSTDLCPWCCWCWGIVYTNVWPQWKDREGRRLHQ